MLKLLRQLRGDSRDVAQLRAETFDEIRDIDSLFSDGSAKHALSAESSVTTTLKNITSGDVLAQIKADMVSTVAIEKIYNVGSSCTNIPATGWFFIKAKGNHVNMRLDAFGYGTKQTYCISLKANVWDNDGTKPKWTNETDASGITMLANAILSSETARNIKVKSGSFTATTTSKNLTYSSAFPVYGFFAMLECSTEAPKLAFSGATGFAFGPGLTIGNTYHWIAFGW